MTRSLFRAEPGASLRMRAPIVVDSGVLAAVLFDEPECNTALRQISGMTLYAPQLIDYELASVALEKARAGLGEIAAQGLADLKVLALERVRVEPIAQTTLAMSFRLSSFDAAYLWLAAELKAPLVTFDARLAKAARKHLFSGD